MANFFDQFDGPAEPAGGNRYADAISSIESSGNYKAVGPATRTGDRALGRYQVMSANIRPWSQEVLGREVTPTEFMADPKIQDAIFNGKFGQYVEKYGPEGASKAWFAGEKGMNDPNRRDVLGTTVDAYGRKFTQALGYAPEQQAAPRLAAPAPTNPVAPQGQQSGNFFDQFDAPSAQQVDGYQVSREGGATRIQPAPFKERFDAVSDEAAFRAVEPEKKEFGLADTWPARVAKSIYGAVTLPGDVAAGRVDPGSDEAIGRSFDLAGVATPMAAAGATVPKVAAKAAQAETPSIQQLKAAATKGYESAEVQGLEVAPRAISDFSTSVMTKLNEAGIDDNLAPEVFGVLSRLQKAPDGSVVTGKNINSLRRMFGNAATSPDPTKRKAAATAMDALDEFLPNIASRDVLAGDAAAASKTLGTARANYSAAKHAEAIDKKAIQAELRAAAANSGRNVANTIRQRMADILIKDKERRGFSTAELAQMEKIVRGTRGQNALRTAGNISGGGGGLGAAITGGGGALALGPVGIGIPIAGFAMKSLSNRMTLKQAEKLSEMIRSRAPLASSMQKFEEKAAQFAGEKSSKTFAGVALAARNFATNLKASGINISPAELMRGVQGGVPARAENE